MMKLAMVAVAAMAAVCAQAEAAVYTFTPNFTSDPGLFYGTDNLSFSIGIDDAAVRSGSFSYDVGYKYNPASNSFVSSATGDVQAFQFFRSSRVSLSTGNAVSGFYEDYFDVALSFDASGQVTAGNVDYSTDSYYVFVTGNNKTFAGTSGFGFLRPANVTGQLVGALPESVPEPATLALLSASVVGFCFQRRARQGR